jgi:hypothetical protein
MAIFPKNRFWELFLHFWENFWERENVSTTGFIGIFIFFPKIVFGKFSMSLCNLILHFWGK